MMHRLASLPVHALDIISPILVAITSEQQTMASFVRLQGHHSVIRYLVQGVEMKPGVETTLLIVLTDIVSTDRTVVSGSMMFLQLLDCLAKRLSAFHDQTILANMCYLISEILSRELPVAKFDAALNSVFDNLLVSKCVSSTTTAAQEGADDDEVRTTSLETLWTLTVSALGELVAKPRVPTASKAQWRTRAQDILESCSDLLPEDVKALRQFASACR
ncbi:hypothetical protein BC831DRAFT_481998 [Entophlyctis helioformis]|nr:hypothetical protein BC831DRAFT_481998 [Entophlyctis helioformis]